MYSNMYCEVRCNTLSICWETRVNSATCFSDSCSIQLTNINESKWKQLEQVPVLVCTDLGAPGCLNLHAFVLPLYRECLRHVPVGLLCVCECVCVCIIMCHIMISYVMIYSINIHDVSRYFNRCRVAREVWGCFGKVIWMACVFVRSFVSFFPPSWFFLFVCLLICLFVCLRLSAWQLHPATPVPRRGLDLPICQHVIQLESGDHVTAYDSHVTRQTVEAL